MRGRKRFGSAPDAGHSRGPIARAGAAEGAKPRKPLAGAKLDRSSNFSICKGDSYANTSERSVHKTLPVRPRCGDPFGRRTHLYRLPPPRTQEICYPAHDGRIHQRSPSTEAPAGQAQENIHQASSSRVIGRRVGEGQRQQHRFGVTA
jgi:hypothetical protein